MPKKMTYEEFMSYGAPTEGGGTAVAPPPKKKLSYDEFMKLGAPTAEDYTAIYQGIKNQQPIGESPSDAYQRNIKLAADMDQGNRGAITGSAPYRVAEDIVSASASAVVNPLLSLENKLGIDAAGEMLSQRQAQYDIAHNRDMGYVQRMAGAAGESIGEYLTLATAGGGFGSALGLGKWGAKALKWATVGGGAANKSYEDTYRSSINSGKTEDEARKIATATAALEVGIMAAFQRVGLGGAEGAIVDGLGIGAVKGAASKTSLQGVKKFLTQTVGEFSEENLTTLTQNLAQEGNAGDWKSYRDTTVQTLGTMGLLSGSQKLINFTTSPSRKTAKEAGVDEIATNHKERVQLATKFKNGLTAAQFEEQLRAAATSPEEADALLGLYRARAESAGESFDDYVGKRIKGVEKTTSDKSVYLAQRQSGKPDALAQEAYHASPYKFDKFTTDRIGTTNPHESAPWGLYFAGSEQVARYYKEKMVDGNVYKVDLKPSKEEYLDWEKPLSQQSDKVKQAIQSLVDSDWIDADIYAKGNDPYGADVYEAFAKAKDSMGRSERSAKLATKRLLSAGVRGILQRGDAKGSAESRHYVIFDGADAVIEDVLAQKQGAKPRGEIQFLKDEGTAIIRAFEGQNISTLAHETGHLFRRDLAGDDLKTAEQWAGAKDGKWDRKAEEKFSRGFERYLAEGTAPSKALENVFAKFKDWLSKVYSVISKSPINVDISPEMRSVFDRLLTPADTQTQGATNGQVQTQGRSEGQVDVGSAGPPAEEPLVLGTSPPPNPDMLSQAPVSPDLAAKNASMDEARAAMGLPAINQPVATMSHRDAEQEAIRQRIPERAAGIAFDILSGKRKEPLSNIETAGMRIYGDRLNEVAASLGEDINNMTLDEGERMAKAAELERIEQDFDLLSRAARQTGTEQGRALSQRRFAGDNDYRPLVVESKGAAAKKGKLTAREKQKLNKTAKELKAADDKLEAQKQKEAAQVETAREKIKKTVKKLKEYVAKTKLPTDLNRYARDLAKQYLAEGVTGRRQLIDKVQKAVREIFPETQRRQVIDAISGYGDFKELSKDEASVRLRDLKGQLQQISKLKDMSDGKAPSKTGMERRSPSDTERELIKQVNEAKKEGGYEVTDPAKQLASALSTIKTRLRNQIRDLQHQIESRQKLIKQKKAQPSDEETKRLTEERDALKVQFDDIFGKQGLTDAQRIANAERATQKSIDELQKRLDAGDFSPAPKYAGNPIPEKLAKLREKAAELRAQYNSSKPVSLDEKKRLKTSIDAAEKSIADLERRIAQGDYAPKPTRPPASSPELTALKERAAKLRAQYNSGKPVSLDEKKRLEAATTAAEKAVTELERRLKEADYSTKPKRPPAISQKIQVLKDRAAALRKKYAETNPNPPALEAAKERLAVLQAHLKNGTVPEIRPRQQSNNPALKAIQQQLADARKQLSQSEPSQKARLRKTIGDLQAKLEAGNFSLPEGAPRPISPEVERLQYERDKLRRKVRAEINALKPESVWGKLASPFNAARSIITTLDLPPVFRQGAFIALGNPVRAARATVAGMKGMFSDFNARKQLEEINNRPNAPLYARARLYLADMDGTPSAREEAFIGRLIEKMPVLRSIVAASERNYTVFLNRLRADSFDAMAASLAKNGEPTMDEAKAIATFINVATGRGDFGQFEAAMTGLAPVFFSPRYVASRFQLLGLRPLRGGTMDTKKLIAKEYGKALIGVGVIYALAAAAGAELEDDMTDSDFGKIKLGNTRLDPLGGLSQTSVFVARMGKGAGKTIESWATGRPRKTSYMAGETMTVGRFLRSKLSPIAATMVNVAAGETAGGDKVTPKQLTQDLTIPLSFRDIKDAIEEQGVPAGVALWLVSLFGVGMQTYND